MSNKKIRSEKIKSQQMEFIESFQNQLSEVQQKALSLTKEGYLL